MTQSIRILFFAGSAREGSHNKKLARLGTNIANANGIPATFADLGDYPMPMYDGDLETRGGVPENAAKLKALLEAHHGVFICSPEYNASITPLMKNTLDWISRIKDDGGLPTQVYRSRVFAVGGASPGRFGGMRSLTHLRVIMELGLGCLVLPDQLAVPVAHEAFDDHGHLRDKALQQKYKEIIQRLAHAAKIMRSEPV
jgi:NAD(P)H-dependent FMN reductase